ncbi:MAG: PadR family transcriptional regulator [Planctomycetota bacterium]
MSADPTDSAADPCPDPDACSCTGRNLDRLLHLGILLRLAAGERHGYRIVAELADWPTLAGTAPDSAGVYRLLRRLASDGLARSRWQSGEAGPARHRYALTDRGRHCLQVWSATLERYATQLAQVRSALAATLDAAPDPRADTEEDHRGLQLRPR